MLPEVKYYCPEVDIAWLVTQFEFISYRSDKELTDKFFPREDVSIVFNFRTPPLMVSPVRQILPPFFIAPVCPTANAISITGPNEVMIVICKPTVLSRVLGINLTPGNTIIVPLPEELFHPLWAEMKSQVKPETKIRTFSAFITDLCPRKYMPDETDRSYDLILGKGINSHLNTILSELSVSERTLQRRFRNRLGATPKMLIRIMRINYLWETTVRGGKIDQHDLVFLGHYFDQTHMIKDFKSITGETPFTFFRRNLGIARIFSGK